ncbi:2-oxoisovalerate dehydrogenase [bacterium]|nr:2-oxoisovalerate dehydrogenase [bacterium]
MKEIIFEVREDPAGGFTASALGFGIHTQGENVDDLKAQLRDAVDCYFDESAERPSMVRLHFVREELMAV